MNYVVFNIVNVFGFWLVGMILLVGYGYILMGLVGLVFVGGGVLVWLVIVMIVCNI